MQLAYEDVQRIILTALQEDIGHGDLTSNAVIDAGVETSMQFVARAPMVVAGLSVAGAVFEAVDTALDYMPRMEDGQAAQQGDVLASIMGNARSILAAERVALNLLQRMCGIASETARYVEAVQDSGAVILDTRKTAPCLRALDKYAVRCGGGQNHRMRLDDAVLIKDNHLALVGSVAEAVARAKANTPATIRIEVECDTLEQVHEALEAGAGMILLDNMEIATLREAVGLCKGKAKTEASGNMSLSKVAEVAATGVDYISVGALTHSVRAADIGLDHMA